MDPTLYAQLEAQIKGQGLWGAEVMGRRLDANETTIFARQLEYIFTQTYDVEYPEYKARSLFRFSGEVPNGAEKWTYRQNNRVGKMKMLSSFGAKDFPSVTVKGAEFSGRAASFGGSYDYSLQDLRAAAMAGQNLDAQKAKAVREAFEQQIDLLTAIGDSDTGIEGVTNFSGLAALGTSDVTGDWQTASVANILADAAIMVNKVRTGTKMTRGVMPGSLDLILPSQVYNVVTVKPAGADYSIGTSIASVILQLNPTIRKIDFWQQLDALAANDSNRGMAMIVDNSANNLSIELPQDFEQFPPQLDGLRWVVNCHGRIAGVKCPYPNAVVKVEGLSTT